MYKFKGLRPFDPGSETIMRIYSTPPTNWQQCANRLDQLLLLIQLKKDQIQAHKEEFHELLIEQAQAERDACN